MKPSVKFGLFLAAAVLLTAVPFIATGQDKTPAKIQDTSGAKKGLRVFFASHSLLWYAPNPIGDLAKAVGITNHKLVGHQQIGGSKTEQHWNLPEGQNQAKKALRSGEVDVFVMSPKQFPDQGIENFVKLGLEHNPTMNFLVQISWSQYDADPLNLPKGVPQGFDREKDPEHLKKVLAPNIKAAESQADEINKKYGKGRKVLFLVPSAQAMIALRMKIYNKQIPGLAKQGELFMDNVHGTPPLEALNTYLHFAALYHHSPVGLPMASMLKNKKAAYDEKFNRILQEIAWEVLTSYPPSGVQAAPAGAQPPPQKKVLIPHSAWTCGMPEGIPSPENGVKVFEAEMQLDQIYDVGKTQYGQRQVLIVKSGTVKGEKLNGTVLPGGLDFQLKISNGVVEIEQILVLKTSDGKNMYVRNAGTGENQNDSRIVANFVAPNDGAYAWLNSGKFVSRRVVDSTAKTMTWTVYNVSDVKLLSDAKDLVKISKPPDVKAQPWDFRKAAASEKKGNQIITETVTLGQGISVGAAKKGNILPITGGKVSGKITGKVLAAGADYQNLSKGAAIDARYLWQTDDGEVIIVRNAGGFGGLVPTFEVRADSKYAWLNSGTYMSSSPGGAAGGVSLTFYESK